MEDYLGNGGFLVGYQDGGVYRGVWSVVRVGCYKG